MADFRSIADDLDQRQLSTSASFASIDDDDDDDKDEDICIILSIGDADVEFEDITIILTPPPPLPYTGAVVPFLGGECLLSTPNLLSAFESATVLPQKMACQLKRPRRRPCRRNRPRVPNHSDEAIPTHSQPMIGGTSMPTTTLPATLVQAMNHCSLSPTLPCPMSYVGVVLSTIRGGCQPLLQVLQATTAHKSAAVTLHWTACRHKRPRHRPGHCNAPWAPNPPDEAIPSHPQPTMGGISMPTLSDLTSVGTSE